MIQPRRMAARVIVLGLTSLGAGCALAPQAQLDACHKLCRSLQAETSQLKDEAVNLRAHNQDLAQRAVADSRKLEELEQDHRRLERSIVAYQEEREQLAASFERMKRQIEVAADPLPTALLRRSEAAADPPAVDAQDGP